MFLGIKGDGNGGYGCSPIDSITFADTGMDGIHYAFLTDFSTEMDLEHTPVICISPMDFGHCLRLVANNLRDFLSLQLHGHETLLLNEFQSREHYVSTVQQHEEERSSDTFDYEKWDKQKTIVLESAKQRFQLEPIIDPYGYIEELRERRRNEAVLITKDQLGVKIWGTDETTHDYKPHPWSEGEIPYDQLDELKTFLSSAATETKLAFIRDYQGEYIEDLNSLLLVQEELERMGLIAEAKRLYDKIKANLDSRASQQIAYSETITTWMRSDSGI